MSSVPLMAAQHRCQPERKVVKSWKPTKQTCSLLLLTGMISLVVQSASVPAVAQTSTAPPVAPIPGLSRQPSPAARAALLDPNDAVVLLLDHQTGLFQTVKDVPIRELRANTVALAKIAGQAKMATVVSSSMIGPLLPPGSEAV